MRRGEGGSFSWEFYLFLTGANASKWAGGGRGGEGLLLPLLIWQEQIIELHELQHATGLTQNIRTSFLVSFSRPAVKKLQTEKQIKLLNGKTVDQCLYCMCRKEFVVYTPDCPK